MNYPISLTAANDLYGCEFERVFGNVIELCVDAAVQVKKQRPFTSVDEVVDAFAGYLDGLSENEKVVVIQRHPDLAGRLAAEGKLTTESASEQKTAGLDRLTPEQKTLINCNNERYKAKFGFPFIICARENKVASIIEGLQRRYNNTLAQEIQTATGEIKKICKLRILDLVKDD
ncbi:2-oxo-4-hydroxy-4-carboxy-5-ureidoimidazoline decarboxylase-like [Choristoneura fumiferana]|uniref:2-oxo-4-hydroxy-4-carboxy-5-ureidoimidazoline decarboxylase-like n=1 Tax=Choristoneura fumiferana TaxID=7141 RepID=UPI003D15623B